MRSFCALLLPLASSLACAGARGLERVPLSSVAEVTLGVGAGRLDRVDGRRAELVAIDRIEGAPRADLEAVLSGLSLPTGVAVVLQSCPACP